MTSLNPEFHLQRVYADGTADPPQVYLLEDLPNDFHTGRRGFIGTGLTATALLATMNGCDDAQTEPPMPSSRVIMWSLMGVGMVASIALGLWKMLGGWKKPKSVMKQVSTVPMLKQSEHDEPPIQKAEPSEPPVTKGNLDQSLAGKQEHNESTVLFTGRPAQSIYAHTADVNALAITPDGKMLASGSSDKTVKLWSLHEGKLLQTYVGHQDVVRCLAITPDGKFLASGADDRTAKLLSLPEGKLRLTYTGHEVSVGCLAITPDSKILASGSGGRTVKLWSLPDGNLLRTCTRHQASVQYLDVTPGGKILASGSSDKTVKLWSLPEGQLFQSCTGHQNSIQCLAITRDGKILASGSSDKTVKLWSLHEEGKLLQTCMGHQNSVQCLAITADGKMLASGSSDKTVKLWSLPEGELLQTFVGHQGSVRSLAITPDRKLLASGDSEGIIILWDLMSGLQLSYAFDPQASKTDASHYNVLDKLTGKVLTYTQPCGSPIPAGATCVCNCVPGTYKPAPPQPPISSYSRGGGYSGGSRGGGSYCSCNTVCTCQAVCQAHRLLHADPVVRLMAEELLLVMGNREFEYLHWAADRAEPNLKQRVKQTITAIQQGARPNPSRWPTVAECSARLNDPDEIVCVMAAQMIDLQRHKAGWSLDAYNTQRVAALLDDARRRPWYVRANEMDPQRKS